MRLPRFGSWLKTLRSPYFFNIFNMCLVKIRLWHKLCVFNQSHIICQPNILDHGGHDAGARWQMCRVLIVWSSFAVIVVVFRRGVCMRSVCYLQWTTVNSESPTQTADPGRNTVPGVEIQVLYSWGKEVPKESAAWRLSGSIFRIFFAASSHTVSHPKQHLIAPNLPQNPTRSVFGPCPVRIRSTTEATLRIYYVAPAKDT